MCTYFLCVVSGKVINNDEKQVGMFKIIFKYQYISGCKYVRF